MSEQKDDVFTADKLHIGTCNDPTCQGVHISFLDEDKRIRAQGVVQFEDLHRFCHNLLTEASRATKTKAQGEAGRDFGRA